MMPLAGAAVRRLDLEGITGGRIEMVGQVLPDGFHLIRGRFHINGGTGRQAEGSARRDHRDWPGDDRIHAGRRGLWTWP